jgi:hypothetical protein
MLTDVMNKEASCKVVYISNFSFLGHVIGWLNGRASVFGTEGCGFEPRVDLSNTVHILYLLHVVAFNHTLLKVFDRGSKELCFYVVPSDYCRVVYAMIVRIL